MWEEEKGGVSKGKKRVKTGKSRGEEEKFEK